MHGYVARICFKTGPPSVVGAELEWLLSHPSRPCDPVPLDPLRTAFADPLPSGSTVTFEPGGQLELSSPAPSRDPTSSPVPNPSGVPDSLTACLNAIDADQAHVVTALRTFDVVPLPFAIDPYREPVRQLRAPRYDAMEAYFDRRGPTGRVMMCSTASVQVNLDAGTDPADVARRWRVLDAVGPVLVAAFANSPVRAGGVTGWKSTRQAVWQRLDPVRTSALSADVDPVAGWAEYALDAPVMLVRGNGAGWVTDPGVTFREWIDGSPVADRPPTEADLAYHLTTLFPPVRPRGWFEVRYLDAQPPEWWPVPIAVLTALVEDHRAADVALDAAAPVSGEWLRAARYGLDDPAFAIAVARCFDAAHAALTRADVDPHLRRLVDAYIERYVARRRCPADDVLAPTSPTEQEEV